MSSKENDVLKEHLKELQEENDRKAFFPFMNQREMYEAMKPDRVGETEYIRKMMEGGLGNVCGRNNPFSNPLANDPKYSYE